MKKHYIAIVGNPHTNASAKAFLNKFIDLIASLNYNLIVFSGDQPPQKDGIIWIKLHFNTNNILLKTIRLIYIWILISVHITKLRRIIDAVIILPSTMIPIVMICKFIKKKVAKYLDGFSNINVLNIFVKIMFPFIDILIVESPSLIRKWHVPSFLYSRISIGSLYVDFSIFKPIRKIDERTMDIGFLGRHIVQKGILELIKAIYLLTKQGRNIKAIIIGGGPLEDIVKKTIERLGMSKNVIVTGIVNYKLIPQYLNDIKLLVFPSSCVCEGVPNAILEAMACGTPVATTLIGGTRDIIKDGITGYIIPCNSYNCVSSKILTALCDIDKLKIVSINSRVLVERVFSFEAARIRYEKILKRLNND